MHMLLENYVKVVKQLNKNFISNTSSKDIYDTPFQQC